MEMREAVRIAKSFVADMLESERVTDIGLEEIDRTGKSDVWRVTIGFSRPWDDRPGGMAAITGQSRPTRSYRVITVDGKTGSVFSMRDRENA